jgi:AraC-like DNA-binding protein
MADGNDDIVLGYHEAGPGAVSQLGREAAIARGEAILLSNADRGWARVSGGRHVGLRLSRAALAAAVPGLEDRLVRPIAASNSNAALRSLSGYLKMLDEAEALATPELQRLVVAHVYDLAALAIGTSRDAAVIAEGRGLRAARLREVIAAIEADFGDPGLSPDGIALKLGVSPRYVQDLLHDTGLTFSARVLELRLQRARAMLADPRHGRLRVGEIADACGFNEIPYFNRCFRRRFGASPTELRGSGRISR